MSTLERAVAIAAGAHAGQTDLGREPYLLHPLRVMLAVETEEERMAAVLHDVVEDSPDWSLERLRDEGFSEAVVAAVDALTKRKDQGESYEAAIARVGRNAIARRVKLADLADNMNLDRIANPSDKDRKRCEKYRRASRTLEACRP